MKEKEFEMIESIKKLTLDKHDILVFRVDVGNLPKKVAEKIMENVCEKAKICCPENKIMVLPSSVDLSVITLNDEEI